MMRRCLCALLLLTPVFAFHAEAQRAKQRKSEVLLLPDFSKVIPKQQHDLEAVSMTCHSATGQLIDSKDQGFTNCVNTQTFERSRTLHGDQPENLNSVSHDLHFKL
jgi:hypothetical protein